MNEDKAMKIGKLSGTLYVQVLIGLALGIAVGHIPDYVFQDRKQQETT